MYGHLVVTMNTRPITGQLKLVILYAKLFYFIEFNVPPIFMLCFNFFLGKCSFE